MDLKFLKDLQDLCEMAGLPTEVRILQEIMDDKAEFKVSDPSNLLFRY